MTYPLVDLVAAHRRGEACGITSVCSAHAMVIEAALRLARDTGRHALIEATCNQVNQEGGYTGMTPAAFREFVEGIAARVGIAPDRIILGGDHLGPNPWKDLPAEDAMDRAEAMIAAFSAAGFTKLHLDTSMGCRGEPVGLEDALTAERAARLAAVAEQHKGTIPPVYVIGTEVPVPGGAVESLEHMQVTKAASVAQTYEVHQEAFAQRGLQDAFSRIIALVVQPGVEFGHSDVVHYDRARARELSQALAGHAGILFEAHSTDYQTGQGLRQLVEDGFAILKVGPWLTFALREALYELDAIADVLDGHPPSGRLMATMERVMLDSPLNWAKYYTGDSTELWLQRHFSYSDRIRYYWPNTTAVEAVAELRSRLSAKAIPASVLSQFMPGDPAADARHGFDELLVGAVLRVLQVYDFAVHG